MITLLALQSLGTRDVCRSHTELGMVFVLLADAEEQSENSVGHIVLVLLNLEVFMKQSHKHNLNHAASIRKIKGIPDYWKSKAVRK